MIEGRPSDTALHVAAARAAHLRYDPPPHLLEDRAAEELLGALGDALIPMYANDGPSWILRENRVFLPFRARFVEDRLAAVYSAGVRQLVVLGAGLDSYAFRRPAEQSALRIFEVDHPSTQRWKRARIAELGWSPPEGHSFVPCDFEKARPSEVLRKAGFVTTEAALVSWMGVIYYLEPETARSALVDLRDMLAPGSEVAFDYLYPVEDLPIRYQQLQQEIAGQLKKFGEPQQNRYRVKALEKEILNSGFAEALVQDAGVLIRDAMSSTDPEPPVAERFGLAVARR